jgi:Zinc finger, C3HC4 type (RING finger)
VRSLLPQCGICLELVVGQQPPSARKFGLLACEHAFCLRCIRSWRGTGESDATTETVSIRLAAPCRQDIHAAVPCCSTERAMCSTYAVCRLAAGWSFGQDVTASA